MLLVLDGPLWFRGFDSIFAFVFGLVTILIALLSYKAYRLVEDNKYKYFSISFFLIAAAFWLFSVVTALLVLHWPNNLVTLLYQFDFVFFLHMLFMLLAYMTLLIVVLKITDRKIVGLLLALLAAIVLFSYQYLLKFHLVSFILLAFLTYQFYKNYKEKKHPNAQLVFSAFYILTAAEVFWMAHAYVPGELKVVAQLFQLAGYLTLFYTFLRITYYGTEKRKA